MSVTEWKQPLSTKFLRRDGQIVPSAVKLYDDLRLTLQKAGITVANITPDFAAYYQTYNGVGSYTLASRINVGTVRKQVPDDWLAAFHYWGGISLRSCFSAIAVQGKGKDGQLLTNGKLNGCILLEDRQYAATFRWHDPTRPYEEQTAQYPNLGWSFHVVHVASRRWCPQGGRIAYV